MLEAAPVELLAAAASLAEERVTLEDMRMGSLELDYGDPS